MRGWRWIGFWALLGATSGWAATALAVAGLAGARTAVEGPALTGDPAALLTTIAELALGVLLARVAACAGVASIALLVPQGRAGADEVRRCDRVALALSPRLLRPVVAISLGAGAALLGAGTAVAAPPATVSASTAHLHASTQQTTPAGARATAEVATLPDAGWRPAAVPNPTASAHPTGSARPAEALPTAGWSPVRPPTDARRPADVALVSPGARHHHGSGTSGSTPHRATDSTADAVVVRRGDTLWSLAARQLGPDASDARVAAQWHRWWHANRAVIGSDPDLLLPGTVLTAPAASEVA